MWVWASRIHFYAGWSSTYPAPPSTCCAPSAMRIAHSWYAAMAMAHSFGASSLCGRSHRRLDEPSLASPQSRSRLRRTERPRPSTPRLAFRRLDARKHERGRRPPESGRALAPASKCSSPPERRASSGARTSSKRRRTGAPPRDRALRGRAGARAPSRRSTNNRHHTVRVRWPVELPIGEGTSERTSWARVSLDTSTSKPERPWVSPSRGWV